MRGHHSSVTLGNSLNLVLLSHSVGVGARSLNKKVSRSVSRKSASVFTYLGGVDDLVGEGLSNALEGSEGRLSGALADQVDSLVHSAQGRHVHSLSAHHTTGSDTGGVLAGTAVGDGSDEHLNGVQASEEVDQFHSLLDNPDSQLLFTVVPVSRGHQHVGQALDNRALSLLESTLLVAASGVRNKDLLFDGLDLEVVSQGHIGALNSLVRPLSEQFGLESELGLAVVHDDFS